MIGYQVLLERLFQVFEEGFEAGDDVEEFFVDGVLADAWILQFFRILVFQCILQVRPLNNTEQPDHHEAPPPARSTFSRPPLFARFGASIAE